MKTPKEKAKELFDKFYGSIPLWEDEATDKAAAKDCAQLAVDEILELANIYDKHHISSPNHLFTFNVILYWQEVKQEIEMI